MRRSFSSRGFPFQSSKPSAFASSRPPCARLYNEFKYTSGSLIFGHFRLTKRTVRIAPARCVPWCHSPGVGLYGRRFSTAPERFGLRRCARRSPRLAHRPGSPSVRDTGCRASVSSVPGATVAASTNRAGPITPRHKAFISPSRLNKLYRNLLSRNLLTLGTAGPGANRLRQVQPTGNHRLHETRNETPTNQFTYTLRLVACGRPVPSIQCHAEPHLNCRPYPHNQPLRLCEICPTVIVPFLHHPVARTFRARMRCARRTKVKEIHEKSNAGNTNLRAVFCES